MPDSLDDSSRVRLLILKHNLVPFSAYIPTHNPTQRRELLPGQFWEFMWHANLHNPLVRVESMVLSDCTLKIPSHIAPIQSQASTMCSALSILPHRTQIGSTRIPQEQRLSQMTIYFHIKEWIFGSVFIGQMFFHNSVVRRITPEGTRETTYSFNCWFTKLIVGWPECEWGHINSSRVLSNRIMTLSIAPCSTTDVSGWISSRCQMVDASTSSVLTLGSGPPVSDQSPYTEWFGIFRSHGLLKIWTDSLFPIVPIPFCLRTSQSARILDQAHDTRHPLTTFNKSLVG